MLLLLTFSFRLIMSLYCLAVQDMWDLTADTDLLKEIPDDYTCETALADLIVSMKFGFAFFFPVIKLIALSG